MLVGMFHGTSVSRKSYCGASATFSYFKHTLTAHLSTYLDGVVTFLIIYCTQQMLFNILLNLQMKYKPFLIALNETIKLPFIGYNMKLNSHTVWLKLHVSGVKHNSVM